jgi:hypothetical protein
MTQVEGGKSRLLLKVLDSGRITIRSGMKPFIENSITNIFSQFDANVTIPCNLRQGYPTPAIYWFVRLSLTHGLSDD